MRPIEYRYERAAARSGPSTTTRLRRRMSAAVRCRRAHDADAAGSPPARPTRVPTGACALPLGQPPEVAAHLLRVDLAAREVHVGVADQPLLVGPDHHPLGEHVVGVGQLRAVDVSSRSGNSTQYSLSRLFEPGR